MIHLSSDSKKSTVTYFGFPIKKFQCLFTIWLLGSVSSPFSNCSICHARNIFKSPSSLGCWRLNVKTRLFWLHTTALHQLFREIYGWTIQVYSRSATATVVVHVTNTSTLHNQMSMHQYQNASFHTSTRQLGMRKRLMLSCACSENIIIHLYWSKIILKLSHWATLSRISIEGNVMSSLIAQIQQTTLNGPIKHTQCTYEKVAHCRH